MVMEGDLTWRGELIRHDTHDVLENYTAETYIILLTNVTLINSIKKKKRNLNTHFLAFFFSRN